MESEPWPLGFSNNEYLGTHRSAAAYCVRIVKGRYRARQTVVFSTELAKVAKRWTQSCAVEASDAEVRIPV